MAEQALENANKARLCREQGRHYPRKRQDIGVCRFQNTGGLYIIEQCSSCKCEYVREIKK